MSEGYVGIPTQRLCSQPSLARPMWSDQGRLVSASNKVIAEQGQPSSESLRTRFFPTGVERSWRSVILFLALVGLVAVALTILLVPP